MGLIDYISRHPVGEPLPPAYWIVNFVVALIDDFVKCFEFQDSSAANTSLNKYPTGYLARMGSIGTKTLHLQIRLKRKQLSLLKVNRYTSVDHHCTGEGSSQHIEC